MGKPATRRSPRNEIAIQTLFRSRLNCRAPQIKVVAITNAAKRGQYAMNQALREGMKPGFPDVMCLAPGGKIAFVEFKDPRGTLSRKQEEWLDGLTAMGFPATVSRDPDHAMRFLQDNGFPFVFEMGGFGVESGAHLHIDHIHPISAGGLTEFDNLQALCSICNHGKGARK